MKKAYKQEIEMWNRVFAECTQEDLIRQYNEDDIDAVMQIWLDTNIRAHNFISSGYWRINFDMVSVAAQNFCQNFSKLLTKLFGKYFRYL